MASAIHSPQLRGVERIGIPATMRWGFVGLLIFMIGDGVELGFISPFLIDQGYSTGQVGLTLTVYGVAVALAAWMSGALSDLIGPKRVMIIGALIWFVFHVLFLVTGVLAGSFAGLLLSYGVRGLGYPLFAYGFLVWLTATTPPQRRGRAAGWFYFAFSAGLPTLGAQVANVSIPLVGQLNTLWLSLGVVALGAGIMFAGVHDAHGSRRTAPDEENLLISLRRSVGIFWQRPRVSAGAVVRVINTTPQWGFTLFMPIFFTDQLGFELSDWLNIYTIMFTSNILWNLIFGFVGDGLGWRRTVQWIGGVGSAVTLMAFYYAPVVFGPNFAVTAAFAVLYGATLAAFVPLSALMPTLVPERKGASMAALNLGAGAAQALGPAIAVVFLPLMGPGGVMWIYAGLYLVGTALTALLRLPDDRRGVPGPERNRQPADVLDSDVAYATAAAR